jgi:hypothetical protein
MKEREKNDRVRCAEEQDISHELHIAGFIYSWSSSLTPGGPVDDHGTSQTAFYNFVSEILRRVEM